MAPPRILGLVNEVLASCPNGCPQPPVPVSLLRKRIAEKIGWDPHSISVQRGNWSAKDIMGTLLRYEQKGKRWAKVLLAQDLDVQWSRWVTCKEMSHLLIDRPEDYSKDYAGLVEGVIASSLPTKRKDVQSERDAEQAGTALLMPEEHRQIVDRLVQEHASDFQIAVHFQVPEAIVERFRSQDYRDWVSGNGRAGAAGTK